MKFRWFPGWMGAAVLAGSSCLLAQQITPVITAQQPPNSAEQQKKHYVVLVSIDGFRYDYAKKYGATHLLAIAKRGASAPEGMIPSYPSLTFPNHYTLVTGLYPEHHGVVGNDFYDPERKARYSFKDKQAETDGTWYGGTPIWSLAVKQGMRTACFFWPGSEAEIAGARPTYYLRFDNTIPDERRVQQVIAWLKLPAAERPHFITLYYSQVDHAGHEFGPESSQVADAVKRVDASIGSLERQLSAMQLPVDLVIVSDHGMARTDPKWITLDQFASLAGFTTVGMSLYPHSEAAAQAAYHGLKDADPHFAVYRRNDVPPALHFTGNERIGDPVVIAKGTYAIRAHAYDDKPPAAGNHGFDPHTVPEMKAIFFAEGPDIRRGKKLSSFENVNVYPLLVKLLGLTSNSVDGTLAPVSAALK